MCGTHRLAQMCGSSPCVMRGLDPRIHVFLVAGQDVDGRAEPGHDDEVISALNSPRHCEAPCAEAIQSERAAHAVWIASLRSQ
jgi:hypothetical protein